VKVGFSDEIARTKKKESNSVEEEELKKCD
jgi:hypothetical protein